jgi:hypothetical protein
MKESAIQAQHLKDQVKSISEIHETIALHKDQFKNIEALITSNKNESKNDINLLTIKLKTSEDSIPPLNVRIQTLEDINRNCDFPISLSTLVGQKLNE